MHNIEDRTGNQETNMAQYSRNCGLTDFNIEKLLGSGSFGSVYLARVKSSQYPLALKLIYKYKIRNNKLALQINREIQIQCELNHPNILRMHGYFSDEKCLYLILEYASRGSLFSALKMYRRLGETTAARYVQDISNALKYCHSRNVIHRDLKPDNLLIGPNNELKLADFGLSAQPHNARCKTFCGTLDYIAPEIVLARPYGYAVDIWSLGVICYEMLVGFPPFTGFNEYYTYQNIVRGVVVYQAVISPGARDLIEKLLAYIPEHRLPLVNVLQHPWLTQNARQALVAPPHRY